MKKTNILLIIAILMSSILLVSGVALAQENEECEDPDRLTYSLIPTEDIALRAEQYEPVYNWLSEVTGKEVEFFSPTSYNGVIEAMRSDFVDVAGFGALAYVFAHDRADAEVFAGRIDANTGTQGYTSAFLTLQDSGIESLEDINGKTFAFTDPGSTSGYLVPAYTIRREELEPGKTIYAGGHQSAALAVKRGQVDAAAVASAVYNRMVERDEIDEDNVVIFHESEELPLQSHAYRGDLCEDLKEDIEEAFLTFHEEAPNAEEFLDVMQTTKFAPRPDSDYERVRELVEIMDYEL